jgi:hypothetical protein
MKPIAKSLSNWDSLLVAILCGRKLDKYIKVSRDSSIHELLDYYHIRLILNTKPGMTSLQSIEVGDFKTSGSCPGR